jgi:polyisoprenoid-binding protein YceI
MKGAKTIIPILMIAFQGIVLGQNHQLKNSKITIKGESSLHEWESQVTRTEWAGELMLTDDKLQGVKDVTVRIPVTGIKSEHGKMMDGKTYDAFNSEKYPHITYRLSGEANASGTTIEARGELTMAGVTKPLAMIVKYESLGNGQFTLTGSAKIKMSDWGMKPPTALMGTVKVGDDVVVDFALTLSATSSLKTQINQ